METAIAHTATFNADEIMKLVVLSKPAKSEQSDDEYQKFLKELQSYGCGYWKWLRKRRIREVFVVDSLTKPGTGKIQKFRIKRKADNFIELANSERFDINSGRSLYGEEKYIFPVENRPVWDAWEPQSLRQRVESVLPALPFKAVLAYADLLQPDWGMFGLFNRPFTGAADALSEQAGATMDFIRKHAKKAILSHLPKAIQEFRALTEMMERDRKC